MKRQVSIQNFFVKKHNVINNKIEISNRNVSSAIVDIVNIVNTDNSAIDMPVAIMDCSPNQEVTINRYDIGNFFNEGSVRSLTNEERLSFLTMFGNHSVNINFQKYQI